jgi:hypothetical protein
MVRVLSAAATVLASVVLGLPAIASVQAPLSDRTLPMRFDMRQSGLAQDGSAEACAATACQRWVSATGVITADTPRDFLAFAEGKDIRGVTIALDSDGGSVLGALALGRAIRALEMTTTVGRPVSSGPATGRARLDPHADCESMCAFVLLAGVRRHVSDGASVLVHQIWIGDRRDDPTAATYSAEDLVLVQRDIGRIAQYLADMGASPEILDLALRIPPWEPMRRLSRDELLRLRIVTTERSPDDPVRLPVANATTSMHVLPASVPAADGRRMWRLLGGTGGSALTRRHPLTVEGDEIGTFDVTFACGSTPGRYLVSYSERRHAGDAGSRAAPLVTVKIGRFSIPLTVATASPVADDSETGLFASGTVPDEAMQLFAGLSSRSLTVATTGVGGGKTSIRIGNTGFARNLPQLAARCEAMTAQQVKPQTEPQAKLQTQVQPKPQTQPKLQTQSGALVQAGDITRN